MKEETTGSIFSIFIIDPDFELAAVCILPDFLSFLFSAAAKKLKAASQKNIKYLKAKEKLRANLIIWKRTTAKFFFSFLG